MKIVYLVHNVGDPAVARRVEMLRAGGAEVVVAGFQRDNQASFVIPGVSVVALGQSFDAKLIQRSTLVLRALLTLARHRAIFEGADVVIARNLEMLALAVRARHIFRRTVPLVYESLDIHRLLLSKGTPGRALRSLERWLMSKVDLVIVSSPAFISNYFHAVQHLSPHFMLLENRLLRLDGDDMPVPQPAIVARRPWRIGWFGMIRCQRSLDILTNLARRNPGLIEVDIRGRPSLSEFRNFEAQIAETPGFRFLGRYRPEDLPGIYGDVHFTWAIDYFEAGLNSDWLLPNRLYEGSAFGAVPIALNYVETGRWLAAHNAGLRLDDISDLSGVLEAMNDPKCADLRDSVRSIPRHDLVATREDCKALVDGLRSLA